MNEDILSVYLTSRMMQTGSDVSFTGSEIGVITGIVSAVVLALGFMFRQYVGAMNDRISDLKSQIEAKNKEITVWQTLAEHGTMLSEVSANELRLRRAG